MKSPLLAIGAALVLAACSAENAVSQTDELREDAAAPEGGAADAGIDATTPSNAFVDPRDGKSYPLVTFGSAKWFGKNLAYAIAGSSFCYDDEASSCETYGRLYLWSVARTACPTGSHLGTDDDWKALEASLGMSAADIAREGYAAVRGTNQGTVLKQAAGFAALPAGFRAGTAYEALGDRTYFWTATTRGADVWRRRVSEAEATIFRFTNPPASFAISVRCVVD